MSKHEWRASLLHVISPFRGGPIWGNHVICKWLNYDSVGVRSILFMYDGGLWHRHLHAVWVGWWVSKVLICAKAQVQNHVRPLWEGFILPPSYLDRDISGAHLLSSLLVVGQRRVVGWGGGEVSGESSGMENCIQVFFCLEWGWRGSAEPWSVVGVVVHWSWLKEVWIVGKGCVICWHGFLLFGWLWGQIMLGFSSLLLWQLLRR